MLTVRSNHLQFDRQLARDLGEDLPRVLRRAVNQTAVEIVGKSGVGRRSFSGYAPVEGYFQKWTKRAFDKPVPFTQRAATMVMLAAGGAAGLGTVTADTGDILRIANAAGAEAKYQIGLIGRSA